MSMLIVFVVVIVIIAAALIAGKLIRYGTGDGRVLRRMRRAGY